ncbi:MAG: DinB family protein [Candidatus Krumholzibacteriia bacterium]
MHASISPIAEILTLNGDFYAKAFDKLDDEMAQTQFAPDTSSITWLLAHLATARFQMGALIGMEGELPWRGAFAHGINEIEHDCIPSLPEIKDCWGDISGAIMGRLPELQDADLAAESSRRFPTSEPTTLAALAFLTQHEVYHLGQLSYIRRLLKEPGLFKLLFLR